MAEYDKMEQSKGRKKGVRRREKKKKKKEGGRVRGRERRSCALP